MEEVSLIDRLKPYQYLYDIISYRVEEDLYKTKQKIMSDLSNSYSDYYTTYNTWNQIYENSTTDNGSRPSNTIMDYGTPGIHPSNFELIFKKDWFSGIDNTTNQELRKKLEENLPEECFIRDEDGNLKKVTKAEAIEHELKSCVVEEYKNPLGNGILDQISRKDQMYNQLTEEALSEFIKNSSLTDNSRNYNIYTNAMGRQQWEQATSYITGIDPINSESRTLVGHGWNGLTTENHL